MFSPSDYNDAVPQFTNGNYANTPLNPLYVEEPDAVNYNRGAEPLQTLPAQWWNWLCNKITAKLNKLNIYVKNIFDELAQLLSLVGITPDATEEEITTGQLKGMFQNDYPLFLKNNFKFESILQGRTRGVMLPPSDTWDANTHTLSLSSGFGILNTYKKVSFTSCSLVLPNDASAHYIVANSNGTISIENTLSENVILIGLCHDNEYLLCKDFVLNQCVDTIKLHKWFGQNKITQGLVSILQSYYNTSIASIETDIFIDTVIGSGRGIYGCTLNNCTVSIGTAVGYGIYGCTLNNCTVSIGTVNGGFGVYCDTGSVCNNCIISIDTINDDGYGVGGDFNNCSISINTMDGSFGANTGTFNNCSISINTEVYSVGTDDGTYNDCIISITTIDNNSYGFTNGTHNNGIISITTIDNGGHGIYSGTFNNCIISSDSSTGDSVHNYSNVFLYLTRVNCSAITDLSKTSGKLNVLNNTVLHIS